MKMNTQTTFSRMDEEKDEFDPMMQEPSEDNRVPCDNCGRKFNPDRLPIHQKSCNNQKKRTVFNSQNKRAVEGMNKFNTPNKVKKPTTNKNKSSNKVGGSEKSSKWRRDHNELVKAIKMSRLIKKVESEGGDISKIPMAPSEPNEDYVECQY